MSKPNFADWAESKFQLMCDDAGVTRNKAFHDRTGWDYLVEFEGSDKAPLPLDRQSGGAAARVQIKSKQRGIPRCELKLSNALHFCRQTSPCFVFLVQSPRAHDYRYFIREFDEELIELTLRRAREADRDDRAANRIRLGVSFGQEHALPENEVIPWIRSRTLVDPVDYAVRKAELNRTLGFDQGTMRGSFTFAAPDIQKLIDHGVGLTPDFEVENVRLDDVRFDIAARQPIFAGKPTIFQMQVHPRKARMTFTGANGRTAKFEGEYRSMNLPGLGHESARATFKAPGLSGVQEGRGPLNLKFKFTGRDRQSLNELCNRVSLMIASRSEVTPSLWIERIGDLPMEALEFRLDNEWGDSFDEWLGALARVTRPADKPHLSMDELGLRQREADRFAQTLADGEMRLEFTFEEDVGQELVITSLVYITRISVGDSTFLAIVKRPCIGQRQTDGLPSVRFGKPEILERAARRGPWRRHQAKTVERFKKWRDTLGRGTVVLDDGDLMNPTTGSVSIET